MRKGSSDARPSPCTRQRQVWTVAERGDYPADVSKLRKLLSGARRCQDRRGKNFESRELLDHRRRGSRPSPAQPGSKSTVAAQDGKHAVIVGKSVGDGNFARRARRERRAIIVEPGDRRRKREPRVLDRLAADRRARGQHSKHRGQTRRPAPGIPCIAASSPMRTASALEGGTPAGRKRARICAAHSGALRTPCSRNLTAEDVAAAGRHRFHQADGRRSLPCRTATSSP